MLRAHRKFGFKNDCRQSKAKQVDMSILQKGEDCSVNTSVYDTWQSDEVKLEYLIQRIRIALIDTTIMSGRQHYSYS